MTGRQWGALVLVGLTACAGAPRGPATHTAPKDAELAALRYELHVLTAGAVDTELVEVDAEEFLKHMRALAPGVRPAGWSRDSARWLLEQALEADLFADTEGERVLRLVPLGDDSPLATASNAQLVARYQRLCAQHYGGGDCFGLLADGPLLDKEAAARPQRRKPARALSPSSATRAATGRSSSSNSAGTCRPTSPSRTSRFATLSAMNSWRLPGPHASDGALTK